MQLLRDLLQDGPGGFHYGRGREVREAEAEDLSPEPINLAAALNVAEEFEGEQDAADGGAGEARGLGDFDDAAAVVVALEAFDDAKPASKGEDKVGVSRLGGELVGGGAGSASARLNRAHRVDPEI